METEELMEEGKEQPKKQDKFISIKLVKKVIREWKRDANFDFGDCEPIALMNILKRQKARLLGNEQYELMPETEESIEELQKFIDKYEVEDQ